MSQTWRLLDTGILTGAQNMALDQALVRVRGRGLSPNTVRFLRFSPPAALVGVYQLVEQEIREDYCKRQNIDINRRITGGGSLLFDTSQLGWELIAGLDEFDIHPTSARFHKRFCNAGILGLQQLGIKADFRPRNDVEVNGRKICGTGGVEDGDAFLFQGTLLVDFDVAGMIKALRIPTEKLKQASLDSAADRVTWISKELGCLPAMDEIKAAMVRGFEETFGITLEVGGLLPEEEEEYQRILLSFESSEWIYGKRSRDSKIGLLSGLHRTDAAAIRVYLAVDAKRKRLRSALVTGDFFVFPQRTIYDLEARLKDARLDLQVIRKIIHEFWQQAQPDALGFDAEDICQAVEAALNKLELVDFGFEMDEVEKMFVVNASPGEILSKDIQLVLLPYCAKDTDCSMRYQNDCDTCGICEVGDVYVRAQKTGMKPVTIVNFEHLVETLRTAQQHGIEAYIGSCCEAFFNKHYKDFKEAKLSGILVDVGLSTCYDLDKRREAYLGDFDGQTQLNAALVNKLIHTAGASRDRSAKSQGSVCSHKGGL